MPVTAYPAAARGNRTRRHDRASARAGRGRPPQPNSAARREVGSLAPPLFPPPFLSYPTHQVKTFTTDDAVVVGHKGALGGGGWVWGLTSGRGGAGRVGLGGREGDLTHPPTPPDHQPARGATRVAWVPSSVFYGLENALMWGAASATKNGSQ